ncbi:cytochrome P450 [Naviculisporaceae sp. PSN 640]
MADASSVTTADAALVTTAGVVLVIAEGVAVMRTRSAQVSTSTSSLTAMISEALLGKLPPVHTLTAVLLGLFLLYKVVQRRYFHPLSHIPGPFLWSVSTLPIFYHQALREGQLMHVLPSLHNKYGPIVRISPNEVHISDPEAYDKIHHIGTKFIKDPTFYTPMDGVLRTPILLTVIPNEEHRERRGPLNPFFSRRSVLELEGIIRGKAKKLVKMMENVFFDTAADQKKGEVIFDMHHAIRAFSVDVITEYAYARCWNQMDMEDYGRDYQDAIRSIQAFFPYLISFPDVVLPIFAVLPDWLLLKVFPPFRRWFDSLETVRTAVTEVRKEISQGIKPPRRTIFHDLMEPQVSGPEDIEALPDGKKQRQVLSDETVFADAVNVTGAGAETTGSTAARAIFEVLSNPTIYQRLSKELRDAFPDGIDSMTMPALEKLPLLTGVIKEALRLSPGIPGHIPRVVPCPGITLTNNLPHLPGGTTVSMSAWTLHHNTEAFANPTVFDPDRWINDDPDKLRFREKCMIPFGRGSRNCIGQNLAMCELYSTIGAIFHRFGFDPAEGEGRLDVGPNFGREDLALVELFLGYHPVKARKFGVVMRT